MVKNVRIEKLSLHFKEPFTIAYEQVTKAPILLLTIEDGDGHIGIGSAAPDEQVTGENIDELLVLMKRRLDVAFFSEPVSSIAQYQKKIRKVFQGYPSAQAATETAARNLAAHIQKKDPQEYFPKIRASCPLIMTIGIKPTEDTLQEARARLQEGCLAIKLKCGLSYKQDIERIRSLRKLLPKDVKLLLDANQGYSYEEAKDVFKAIKGLDIEAMEQPIPAHKREDFKKLKKMGCVPLIADEMAKTREEALSLLETDEIDGINVKMMKYGGATSCSEVIEKALKESKLVMLGCMYESNISITAAAYLALAYPVQFVDLDSGHFDFDDDPVLGGALVKNGLLSIESIPHL